MIPYCKCKVCRLSHVAPDLLDLVKILLENDPDVPIADSGVTVLDNWRQRARHIVAFAESTER